MSVEPNKSTISVIVPTIGRPEFLRRLLESLCNQTYMPHEVLVADGSSNEETAIVTRDELWQRNHLSVKQIAVQPPNAVRQRLAAIAQATGEYLLLLDDDVVLESDCVAQMIGALGRDREAVAVFANFSNLSWPMPTRAWKFYLRHILGMKDGAWQGRVVGPLLRFGFNPVPSEDMPISWIGAGNSVVRRSAYEQVGGFSDFFLHRCTTNEDVDLGLKLSSVGRIVFCPRARMAHHHAPSGRVPTMVAAEDDLYNRFLVMRRTQRLPRARAFGLIVLYLLVETASNIIGSMFRLRFGGATARLGGRLKAMARIVFGRTDSHSPTLKSTEL